jgi:hypothetical protein
MRKIIYILTISLFVFSCEDVIEVDLDSTEPKLVIDASLNWVKGTSGNFQFIKLTLTAPFFSKTIPPANGATVTVTNSNNVTFDFIEEGNTGIYRTDSFIPSINEVYKLSIDYKDEIYTAIETLTPVTNINFVEQKNNGGFSGNDTEIKAFYNDPIGIRNYYLFEFISTTPNLLSIEVYNDEFNDGNQIFAFYSDEDLKTGDELIIRGYGISRRYFEFMNILIQQRDDESGDPFETQPATVRGNCLNQTNPNNFPLGYFRASEVSVFNYTIN